MDGEINNTYQIKPLTKICKETGEFYFRRDDVKFQIIDALDLSENDLLEKISQLKSETLVFLFREKYQANYKIAGKIWEILSERILRIANRERTKFNNETDFEDFVSQIQVNFFTGISNLESNEFDYAQASFGKFIKGKILNELRKKYTVQNRGQKTIWLDDEENLPEKTPSQLIAKMTDAEKTLVFRHALKQLPREIFEVCYLHYLEGIQIHSIDQSKITLTRIFHKSDKTIRTWLGKAEEILSEYKGELR